MPELNDVLQQIDNLKASEMTFIRGRFVGTRTMHVPHFACAKNNQLIILLRFGYRELP
jgi:hypothetical protein